MKILFLTILFGFFLTNSAFAEVEGKVLSYEQEVNGNIVVVSEYKLNGKKIVSNYPDGNWRTRYTATNFSKERILTDIKAFCERNVWKQFNIKANAKNKSDQDKLEATNPDKITNISYKTSIAIRQVDTDADGEPDEIWTIKDDGSKSVSPITP